MQNYPKYQKSMLGQNSGDYKGYSGVFRIQGVFSYPGVSVEADERRFSPTIEPQVLNGKECALRTLPRF